MLVFAYRNNVGADFICIISTKTKLFANFCEPDNACSSVVSIHERKKEKSRAWHSLKQYRKVHSPLSTLGTFVIVRLTEQYIPDQISIFNTCISNYAVWVSVLFSLFLFLKKTVHDGYVWMIRYMFYIYEVKFSLLCTGFRHFLHLRKFEFKDRVSRENYSKKSPPPHTLIWNCSRNHT